jgi:hypothetical protein
MIETEARRARFAAGSASYGAGNSLFGGLGGVLDGADFGGGGLGRPLGGAGRPGGGGRTIVEALAMVCGWRLADSCCLSFKVAANTVR